MHLMCSYFVYASDQLGNVEVFLISQKGLVLSNFLVITEQFILR